jgi:hypothetical protein
MQMQKNALSQEVLNRSADEARFEGTHIEGHSVFEGLI